MVGNTRFLIALILLTCTAASAQDKRMPAKEVPFDTAKFPIVLKADPKNKVAAYIAIPVERVKGSNFNADVKFLVDKHPGGPSDSSGRSVSFVLQSPKTERASGFWASSRTLVPGKTMSLSINTSSASSSRKKFYIHVHIPYHHGDLKIVDIKLTGYKFIECEVADKAEEKEIREAIKQLGDDGFKVRRAAQKKILGYGEKAVAIAREFKDDDDPERRERIRNIIKTLEESLKDKYPPVQRDVGIRGLPDFRR